jgi:hypothetical protein
MKNNPNYYIKFSLPVSCEMLKIGINHHLFMNATLHNGIEKFQNVTKYQIVDISRKGKHGKDFQIISSQKILELSNVYYRPCLSKLRHDFIT